ncbi:PaaX family transcriptional regulator [Streptomyces sp. RB6PN25]|uniref:PaaX family transcriptional regulator n=1 Tax=Streptomyces humicola TaxID=2953240 RepID=A0ABT1PSY8_9ACTN|nr:PaaX family transcriptional regulator C-terminal domain-containing protein [Streptomyces humicola]MCQ4080793.1 PaaX family transcriptional regulator [Streptomyces humicola]
MVLDAEGQSAGERKPRAARPADEARPKVSRRREVGHTSARSLLATILGEYVLPRDRPVWTSALVEALGMFEIEEKSARQALARTAAEGWLTSERVGRRVRWALTPPGRRLLTEGAERIYSFGNNERQWDGTWLVILVSVPEAKRELRHRLRTQLAWAGFGTPETGVWISPDTRHEAEALTVLKELGLSADAMSFTANYGAVGSEETMVSRAWDLRDVEARYEAFIDEFTGAHPVEGNTVFQAQTRLVHEWRRFPFLDPQLPRMLLPERWSGVQAADLFHRMHGDWHEHAQQRWDRLMEEHSAV